MDCVKLSLEKLKEESRKLAQKAEKDGKPDLVIYVARGGYLIGKEIADYFQVPCAGIYAERRGGGLKERVAPILKVLPDWLKMMLRKMELKSGMHKTHKERNVYWDAADFERIKKQDVKSVLLVDDSVDTGYSMIQVMEKLFADFGKDTIIKTAAVNVWSKSEEVCATDYRIYTDTIIMTPMSKDSEEYAEFEELYRKRNG